MTCTTCPNCGFDLARVETLQLGDLEIVRGSEVRWKGRRVTLSISRTLIVSALAKADGAWVGTTAIAEVVGYDGDDPSQLVNVHICMIRRAFRAADPAFDRIERGDGRASGGFSRWRTGP